MKPLNEKQQKILTFLKERAQDGLPPTVREICAAAGGLYARMWADYNRAVQWKLTGGSTGEKEAE